MQINIHASHEKVISTVTLDEIVKSLRNLSLSELRSVIKPLVELEKRRSHKEAPKIRIEAEFDHPCDALEAYDLIADQFDCPTTILLQRSDSEWRHLDRHELTNIVDERNTT